MAPSNLLGHIAEVSETTVLGKKNQTNITFQKNFKPILYLS